jgi:hypothetical protein
MHLVSDQCITIAISFFLEFLKLVEIAMVHVLGFVEDEHCFSFASFLKTKLCNCLDPHLELVIAMFSQKFFLIVDNFPYQAAYDSWSNVHLANGHGRYA